MSLTAEQKNRRRDVIDEIVADMESDVAAFDGKPLTGKTVAEIHGTLAATVQALAKVVGTILDEMAAADEQM